MPSSYRVAWDRCSLPMARTCLRETVDRLQGDEVRAFALLQTAFAASCVVGPALGGVLYGWPAGGFTLPWSFTFNLAACLYVLAIAFTYKFLAETVDMSMPLLLRSASSNKVSLLSDASIVTVLIMVAGHSFVFTGWEVTGDRFLN